MRIINPEEQKLKSIKRALQIHGDVIDYSKFIYKDYMTTGEMKCKICGYEFYQSMHKHLTKKRGCPSCGNKKKGITYKRRIGNKFFEHCKLIHNDFFDYTKSEYTDARSKIIITCPIHGDFIETAYEHKQGHGCSKCSASQLEREIERMLLDNNIVFESQKTFTWLKHKSNLKLDFYLSEYNIAIECQGQQHFEPVKHFGGEEELEKVTERDNIKFILCEEKKIEIFYYTKFNIKKIKFDYLYENRIYNNISLLMNKIKKTKIL